MKIAIVGAGATGIISTIVAKKENKNLIIDLFENNSSVGKKILASGNGRCNISNTHSLSSNYIGEDNSFVEYALKEFDFKKFEKFCNSIGLFLDVKEDGKVYPLSNEAKSVVTLFQSTLNELGINIFYDTKIIDVNKEKNSFILSSEEKSFEGYDKVLIASGLGAAPQLGATEMGLDIAIKLGHSVNPTYPSLVGLNIDSNYHHKLMGLKKEALVTLYINGKSECEISGDILFTKYGISGFAILDISQYASYYLSMYQQVEIGVNFFPNFNKNDLISKIENSFKSLSNHKAVDLLGGIISNKLAPILLEVCGLGKDIYSKDVNAKSIRTIVNKLQNWRFKINETSGFSHAEVSGGGVRVCEIDKKSCESKLVKNLYFGGEVLDIVGHRGGYNFQFAWACGYLIGKELAK